MDVVEFFAVWAVCFARSYFCSALCSYLDFLFFWVFIFRCLEICNEASDCACGCLIVVMVEECALLCEQIF